MIKSWSTGSGVENASLANIVTGTVGTAIVLALSLPALVTFYRSLRRNKVVGYQPVGDVYEDEDGKATEESQKQFNTFLPRLVALVASMLGVLTAIVSAVLKSLGSQSIEIVDTWLRAGCWVKLLHSLP